MTRSHQSTWFEISGLSSIRMCKRSPMSSRLQLHALHRLRSIRRSFPGPVLQSLLSCLVLSRLDHGNAVLDGISVHLKRLQSVINSAARLVFSSSKFDHETPLLRQLHWLSAPWRINFKLAVLAF